jgi:anti-sigma B factor antagonist
MNISTEEINNTIVIHIDEERLDAHNSGELKVVMQQLFADGNLTLLGLKMFLRDIETRSGFRFQNAISNRGFGDSSLQPQVKSMFS